MSSSTFNSESLPSGEYYAKGGIAAVMVILLAWLVASLWHEEEPRGLRAISERLELERDQPEMLLLGDSMLGEGVDAERLEKLLGVKLKKVAQPGSASAFWYAYFHHVVMASRTPPPVVVMFFRDHFLTAPEYRTEDPYRERIRALCVGRDGELEKRAYGRGRGSPFDWLSDHIALLHHRAAARRVLEWFTRDVLTGVLTGVSPEQVAASLSFSYSEDRSDPLQVHRGQVAREEARSQADYDFPGRLPDSFLPLILEMAKEKGIRLVFVRVKRRRDVSEAKPPALVEYDVRIEEYLKSNKSLLLDYTAESSLGEDHFALGDHLNREGRRIFTDLLGRDLKRLVVPGP